MTTTAPVQVEWILPKDAGERLGLSARRALEYASGGTVRSKEDINPQTKRPVVMLHAGDVERLVTERQERRHAASQRAAMTLPQARSLQRAAELRARDIAPPQPEPAAPARFRPLLTLDEAEEYAGIPASLLRIWIEKRGFPAVLVGRRAGGKWRIRRADLDVFAESVLPRGWCESGVAISEVG